MKVSVNPPKTPVTKGSNGIAAATIPNVCKMPGPPAPFIPVPLPNIGKSGDSPKGYTKKVKVEGNTVAIKGATFKSMGDVASKGTGGGLISANTHGPTKFVGPGSMNVKFEGKNVQYLGDPMLNNCGGSGSPPNSATLLGVLQGPLMLVVTEENKCSICAKAPHEIEETAETKIEAQGLESSLKAGTEPFAPDQISMLAVVHCQCGSTKAAARSTTRRSPDFTKVASGYLTPKDYKDYSPKKVMSKLRALTENKKAFDKCRIAADEEYRRFRNAKETVPQANEPGNCAAPRAVLLLLEQNGLPGALTERWCGSPTMSGPVLHWDATGEERRLVDDKVFKHGESVPPCKTCNALLPVLLCDEGKKRCCSSH